MTKSEIFTKAHQIAKSIVAIVGDYVVSMSLALKKVYKLATKATIQEIAKKYAEIKKQDEKAAQVFAGDYVSSLNLATPAERGQVWAELKSSEYVVSEKPTKKPTKKVFESIGQTCKQISLYVFNLSASERKFINDIKTKRKLTIRQSGWLKDIAARCNIEIQKEFNIKESKSHHHCNHEDLGSLGYKHGETVKCPHCGKMAEVW